MISYMHASACAHVLRAPPCACMCYMCGGHPLTTRGTSGISQNSIVLELIKIFQYIEICGDPAQPLGGCIVWSPGKWVGSGQMTKNSIAILT